MALLVSQPIGSFHYQPSPQSVCGKRAQAQGRGRGGGGGHTTQARGRDLRHQQPRDRPRAQRKAHNVCQRAHLVAPYPARQMSCPPTCTNSSAIRLTHGGCKMQWTLSYAYRQKVPEAWGELAGEQHAQGSRAPDHILTPVFAESQQVGHPLHLDGNGLNLAAMTRHKTCGACTCDVAINLVFLRCVGSPQSKGSTSATGPA